MSDPPMGFADAIAAMPSLSLEDVSATAQLQTRIDRKYVVDLDTLDDLFAGEGRAVLEIDGKRSFRYETVYFDTPDLRLYLDTAYRRPRRFKVRIRTYLDSDSSMLEVKRKDGRGNTVKLRLAIDPGRDRHNIDDEMRAFIDAAVETNVTPILDESITISFRRTTVVDVDHDARYTIDHHLTAIAPDGGMMELADAVVLECKSAYGRTPVDHRLWARGLRPARMSKYCTALAILNPTLPSNHWHRTLRRHFGATVAVG